MDNEHFSAEELAAAIDCQVEADGVAEELINALVVLLGIAGGEFSSEEQMSSFGSLLALHVQAVMKGRLNELVTVLLVTNLLIDKAVALGAMTLTDELKDQIRRNNQMSEQELRATYARQAVERGFLEP